MTGMDEAQPVEPMVQPMPWDDPRPWLPPDTPASEVGQVMLVRCDECGVAVVDQRLHSTWHAWLDGTGTEASVLAWLDALDVQEVERLAFTDQPLSASPVACVLDALRRIAGAK